MPLQLTILLVDDHKFLLGPLRKHLLDTGLAHTVLQATSGTQALELLKTNTVDVVCMDYYMPTMDGIACTRSIKKLYPKTKVLFISSTQKPQKVADALEAGADGYLSKGSDDALLPKALETIMAGKNIYLCPLALKAFAKVALQTKKQQAKLKPFGLTSREFDVAILYGKGDSLDTIKDKLSRSKSTIQGHRDSIFEKLGVHSQAELMAFFNDNGDMFGQDK